jgi:hypothetical protein
MWHIEEREDMHAGFSLGSLREITTCRTWASMERYENGY